MKSEKSLKYDVFTSCKHSYHVLATQLYQLVLAERVYKKYTKAGVQELEITENLVGLQLFLGLPLSCFGIVTRCRGISNSLQVK